MNATQTMNCVGITVAVSVVASIIRHDGVTLWTAWYPILATASFLITTAALHWGTDAEQSKRAYTEVCDGNN